MGPEQPRQSSHENATPGSSTAPEQSTATFQDENAKLNSVGSPAESAGRRVLWRHPIGPSLDHSLFRSGGHYGSSMTSRRATEIKDLGNRGICATSEPRKEPRSLHESGLQGDDQFSSR